MEINVINVGNSKGIIIPAKFLKMLNLKDKVKLNLLDNKIIIEPVTKLPREGWEVRIKADIKKMGYLKWSFLMYLIMTISTNGRGKAI